METFLERMRQFENRCALEDLNNDFCHHLDQGEIEALVDLFCEDAVYSHGSRLSRGREEIRNLFRRRNHGGVRTSRHLQTGLRLQWLSHELATGTSVCLTFAANGPSPIPWATPYLVADFTDRYRLCRDGRWRIEKRHIERIFTAPDNPGPVGTAVSGPPPPIRTAP